MPMPRSPSSRGAAWPASRARRCGWRSGAASTPSCSCRRCSIPFRRGRTRTSWPRCAPASSSSSRTRGSCTGCCGCSSICPTVWGRSPAAARIRLRRPRSWSGWSSSRRACSGPECPKSASRLIEGDHVSVQVKDFKSDLKPIWCPGCGDFGVLQAMYRALSAVGRPPHEIAFVSGIGCSSRIPGYTTAYGFNTVHGRALPIAQGIKLSRPDLLVLAAGGDGDGFSIGGGHVPHAIRRNLDITYIVMDNHIYVLAYGARFVAQGTPADMPGLAAMIEEAIRFPGFAFVNVQSPCITYGQPEAQLKQHKAEMTPVASIGHDPANRLAAMALAQEYGKVLYTGVLYRNPDPGPTFEQAVAERHRAQAGATSRAQVLDVFTVR